MPLFVHYPALACAAAFYFLLGGLWYGLLFRKPWMRLMGLAPDHTADSTENRRAIAGYVVSIICSLALAWVMSHFVAFTGAHTAFQGLQVGLICWAGFTLTTMLPNHLFSQRPIALAWINLGYPLVGFLVMGMILAAWRAPVPA